MSAFGLATAQELASWKDGKVTRGRRATSDRRAGGPPAHCEFVGTRRRCCDGVRRGVDRFLVTGDPGIPIALAVLGVTLALIGPGEWSVDARLYGRKHFVPLAL
jgi:hypothetical protein